MSIGGFWNDYPKVYFVKALVSLSVEFTFLYFSATVLNVEWHIKECPDWESEDGELSAAENLKNSLVMLSAIHFYNVIRIIYLMFVKIRKIKVKASILKCCLTDCYCCLAAFCFVLSQIVFFRFKDYCHVSHPNISWWLKIEVIY